LGLAEFCDALVGGYARLNQERVGQSARQPLSDDRTDRPFAVGSRFARNAGEEFIA
jgi:hypothetical protein